jgi:hypothetical protein
LGWQLVPWAKKKAAFLPSTAKNFEVCAMPLIEAETGPIVYGGTLCWSIAGGDNTSRRLLTAAGMGLRKISSNTNVGRHYPKNKK